MSGQIWWQRRSGTEWQSSDWRFRVTLQDASFTVYDEHYARPVAGEFETLAHAQLACNALWRDSVRAADWVHAVSDGQTLCGETDDNALVAHEGPTCPLCTGMIHRPIEEAS